MAIESNHGVLFRIGRRLGKALFRQLFKRFPEFRASAVFEFQHRFFHELKIAVPIGESLWCPISAEEHWFSFREIFFEKEYERVFQLVDLPSTWLDLGCHAGFFSLDLLRRRRQGKRAGSINALLVDADPRSKIATEAIVRGNCIDGSLTFLHGAIAGTTGSIPFFQRGIMDSSLDATLGPSNRILVPIITPEKINESFPLPIDLIKLDIEGAEVHFFRSYRKVFARATDIVLEWHQLSSGGDSRSAVVPLAKELGFNLVADFPKSTAKEESGVMVLTRNRG